MMRAISVSNTKSEDMEKPKGIFSQIKRIICKIGEAEIVDVDAIMKSKEWPYLWRK